MPKLFVFFNKKKSTETQLTIVCFLASWREKMDATESFHLRVKVVLQVYKKKIRTSSY